MSTGCCPCLGNFMTDVSESWDYLIVTASNDRQASAYESQLRLRTDAGRLPWVRRTMVVADLDGRRIGSGASTLDCLIRVVNAERRDGESVEATLGRQRILIIHAGGDSRRLPAYGPAGKVFVPLPDPIRDGIPATLFDRIALAFLRLPAHPAARGQVMAVAGDALILFDAEALALPADALTIVGCYSTPEESARHGVFCVEGEGRLRLYLQKPSIETQRSAGAIDREGRSVLDIGIMSFDAAAGAAMLAAFGVAPSGAGRLEWSPTMRTRILEKGVDLYREICCAFGASATLEHYIESAQASGSKWTVEEFAEVFAALNSIPVNVRVVPSCRFLHFGSTGQLIPSGTALAGVSRLAVNSEIGEGGSIEGESYWVEGCSIHAPVRLAGRNVVIGVDVEAPLDLPEAACLDVLEGANRKGDRVWFLRPHGAGDTFKHAVGKGGAFCGLPIMDWLEQAGAAVEDLWDEAVGEDERTLWNARVFPTSSSPVAYRDWLWFFNPREATPQQRIAFRATERFSASEIALLTDQDAFHRRRVGLARR